MFRYERIESTDRNRQITRIGNKILRIITSCHSGCAVVATEGHFNNHAIGVIQCQIFPQSLRLRLKADDFSRSFQRDIYAVPAYICSNVVKNATIFQGFDDQMSFLRFPGPVRIHIQNAASTRRLIVK